MAAGLDPDRCILFVQSHVRGAHRADLDPQLRGHDGRAAPHDPVQGQGQGPGVGQRRAVRLPGAHGRRHPRSTTPTRCRSATTSASTSSSPATSRSGSTTASATPSWCPRPRSRRWARGSWTSRTRRPRCRSRPTRPRARSRCSTRRRRSRSGSSPRSPTPRPRCASTPRTKPGVSNLLQILAATSGRSIPDVEAEFAGRRLRRVQGRRRRRRRRVPRAAPGALRGARGRPGRGRRAARRRARPRPKPSPTDVARAACRAAPPGLLPSHASPTRRAQRGELSRRRRRSRASIDHRSGTTGGWASGRGPGGPRPTARPPRLPSHMRIRLGARARVAAGTGRTCRRDAALLRPRLGHVVARRRHRRASPAPARTRRGRRRACRRRAAARPRPSADRRRTSCLGELRLDVARDADRVPPVVVRHPPPDRELLGRRAPCATHATSTGRRAGPATARRRNGGRGALSASRIDLRALLDHEVEQRVVERADDRGRTCRGPEHDARTARASPYGRNRYQVGQPLLRDEPLEERRAVERRDRQQVEQPRNRFTSAKRTRSGSRAVGAAGPSNATPGASRRGAATG